MPKGSHVVTMVVIAAVVSIVVVRSKIATKV